VFLIRDFSPDFCFFPPRAVRLNPLLFTISLRCCVDFFFLRFCNPPPFSSLSTLRNHPSRTVLDFCLHFTRRVSSSYRCLRPAPARRFVLPIQIQSFRKSDSSFRMRLFQISVFFPHPYSKYLPLLPLSLLKFPGGCRPCPHQNVAQSRSSAAALIFPLRFISSVSSFPPDCPMQALME